jgi:hypothetical protein
VKTRLSALTGREELARRVYPSGTVEGKAARGDDVVYVGMNLEVLSPRMEHAKETIVCSSLECPRRTWTVRRSAPASTMWVAKQCLKAFPYYS